MVRQIMVVNKEVLFPNGIFSGFISSGMIDFMDKILDNYHYLERNDELESNVEFLQIIPYLWILNKKTKQAFLYQRGLGKDYQEKRHLEKYSGGIGGHVDKEEIEPENPVIDALNREMREETIMESYPEFKFIGYLHREDDLYEKVHLGVLAVAETEYDVKPTDDGIKTGKFHSIEEIDALMARKDVEFDKWTMTSWPLIREYLLN